MSREPMEDPVAALVAAVKADDAGRVAQVLDRHPELKSRLDESLPGSSFGGTALLAAVQRGNREMIDVLLGAGADVNGRSDWWAGSFGVLDDDHGLASFLIERGAVVDAHAAARLGRLDRLQELVAADPEMVHARGGDGKTPLHFAANVEIARFLLAHGADVDARDIDHESTPAQYMVRDRQDVARYLITRGCRTDLLMAAALGDLELVRRLLDADPDGIHLSVCERDFPKQDPRSGGSIYIYFLGWNKTAHEIAREHGHEEVFRLLMERSPAEMKLAVAGGLGDETLFRELLASHPGVAATLSEDGRRKLADAAQNNNTAAVRRMLAAGWPVNARGQHNATPLHWAAWHGNAEMVREILRYHPPLELRGDDFDLPPLGWAVHGSENGWYCRTGDYAGTVDALLQAGAKPPEPGAALAGSEPVREALRRWRSSTARADGGEETDD